ncbi:MAG TPA: hypothetical protein VEI47_03250 [Gemmatimonadales bacterium]|nr:hypothetical protein [Gemmatimonadales bacterium]
MALKLSAKQQSQLAFLELLPPKFARIQTVIEQMNNPKLDETAVRGMIRVLDEMKAGASQLSLNGLAEALGAMGSMARRGGGLQVKIRGLRDLMGSVKSNHDAAMKKASIPEASAPDEPNAGETGN